MAESTQGSRSTPSILVVEDDPTISDLLAYNLVRAGFSVRQERSGTGGLEAALTATVDLVLLDLMLPGLDGVAAAREIRRRRPALPIIMLTARADRDTVLRGFEAGADDFVTKPFDMDVLLARIQARLRGSRGVGASPAERREMIGGDLRLDPDNLHLSGPNGSTALKPKEYGLLELLVSQPGRIFPRDELVERVWHQKYLPGSRSLDVHVRRVRRKLGEVGSGAAIDTSRGIGYRVRISTVDRSKDRERST